MTDDLKNVADSWEELLEDELTEAVERIRISVPQKGVDPFSSNSSTSSQKEKRFDRYRHLAILSGTPIGTEDVLYKLRRDFGDGVRLKKVDDSNCIIIFSNAIDAGNAVKNSHKFLPLRLYDIDDPDFQQHLDLISDHEKELRPTKITVRPATNMTTIRNTVSRHLNIDLSSSLQHREDKERLKRAREAKQAKTDLWN